MVRYYICIHSNHSLAKHFINFQDYRNQLCRSLTMASSKKLNNIRARIDDFSKTGWTSSEPNTKRKIIEPLLKILGWDASGGEVRLEYPIVMASGTSEVDYALMLENKPVVFVEAKAFDTVLTAKHARQAISYGKVEDVQWVVLTNGKTLKVFDTKQGKTEKDCLVVEVDLTKLPVREEDLNLISRGSILSGDIEDAVKRLAATKRAIRNLKQKRGQIAEEFRKTLLKIAGKEVKGRIESLANQLATQAIQTFEKQSEAVTEETFEKRVQLVARKQLATKPSGKVVVCPSKTGGVEFLKKYNAWGFVKMREEDIPYFALYVGRPESSILYFGEIDSITKPLKSKEDIVKIQETDIETFEPGTRVIHLKPGTLVKFVDPIPLKNKRFVPKGRLYTTLRKLTQADSIGFLWGVGEITAEYHFRKIKDAKLKKIASELRDTILRMANDITERVVKSSVRFRTSINFAEIYTHRRHFWLSVRVPKAELNMPELDARARPNPKWTDIRVDEKTSFDLLIKAARQAYEGVL